MKRNNARSSAYNGSVKQSSYSVNLRYRRKDALLSELQQLAENTNNITTYFCTVSILSVSDNVQYKYVLKRSYFYLANCALFLVMSKAHTCMFQRPNTRILLTKHEHL